MSRRAVSYRPDNNVKRIRTYETPVSDSIVLSAEVPSLQELCAHTISNHDRSILGAIDGSISNPIAQLLLKYLEEGQVRELIADEQSFLNDPTLCQIYEFSLKFYIQFSEGFVAFLLKHKLRSLSLCNAFIDYTTLDQLAQRQKQLEHLDISYCLKIERFDPIFKFEALTFLNLQRTHFRLSPTTAHSFVW